MSDFKDVPTEQLLSFQEFTPVHEPSFSNAQLNIDVEKDNYNYTQTTINDNINDFTSNDGNKGIIKINLHNLKTI